MLNKVQKNVAFVAGMVFMLGAGFVAAWAKLHGVDIDKNDMILIGGFVVVGLICAMFDRLLKLVDDVLPMLPFTKKKE